MQDQTMFCFTTACLKPIQVLSEEAGSWCQVSTSRLQAPRIACARHEYANQLYDSAKLFATRATSREASAV